MQPVTADDAGPGRPFVLVHGSCHGGWCWSRVAPRLRAAGHEVFTPTLTGFGERAHLLGPDVRPSTLVEDVVAVLEYEDLRDVVLVGHSFGALVNLEVADRVPERLARLVMLDGLVVEPGRAGFDGIPREVAEQRSAAARAHDGGLSFPPSPATAFGLTDPGDVAWVDQRLTPHPLRTYAEPFAHRAPLGNGLPVTFVVCTDPPFPVVAGSHAVARREGWTWRELPGCHDAMIATPDLVVAELLRAAATQPDTAVQPDTATQPDGATGIRAGSGRDTGTVLGMLDDAVAWLAGQGRGGQWGTRPWSADPQRVERVQRMVADGELWIAQVDGRPAGALVLAGRAPDYAPPADEGEVYVTLLVTARAFAGRRVGSHLLDHARGRARDLGVSLVRVDCWAGADGRLVDYYRAAGFTPSVGFAQGDWPGQILEQRLAPS